MHKTCLMLVAMMTLNAAADLLTGILYSDFEAETPMSIGGEGLQPESRLDVTTAEAHGGSRAARLHYRFREGIAPRQYVELNLGKQLSGNVRSIAFWLKGDTSKQRLKLRVMDASGEMFQYNLGLIDWSDWRQVRCDLTDKPEVNWGDLSDGKLDAPLTFIRILIDSPVQPFESTLLVDDVTYDAEGSSEDFIVIECAVPVLGNAFYGRAPAFDVSLENLLTTAVPKTSFTLSVAAADGTPVSTMDSTISLAPDERRTLSVSPELHDYGLYRATLVFGTRRETYPFTWLPQAASAQAAPESPFGVSMHFGHGSRGPLEKNLQLASDMGMRWLRDDGSWAGIEREKGVYRVPPAFDRFLRTARTDYGCEPLIILDYGNSLYEENRAVQTDEGRRAFAAWSEFMARTYQETVRYWEVWNEPNIGFWEPKPNPADYAKLLKATYAAVKKGNPDAVVIAMVTAGIDLTFIENVLKEDTVGAFDAVSVHPYRYPTAPEEGDQTMLDNLQQLVDLLARYGAAGTPIYNTEVGWPNQDDPRGLSEQTTADYLSRMYTQLHAIPDVKSTFWYDFQNDGLQREYNEHNFGILNHDFTPKAPAVAYRMTSMVLEGSRFVGRLDTGDTAIQAYLFAGADGRTVLAAWALGGPGCLTTRWPPQNGLRSVSASGPIRNPDLDRGVLVTELSSTPVFLQGSGIPECVPTTLAAAPMMTAPNHSGSISVTLRNARDTRIEGPIALTLPEGWRADAVGSKAIAPGGEETFELVVTVGPKAETGKIYPISLRWSIPGGDLLGLASAAVTVCPAATIHVNPVRTASGYALALEGETTVTPPPRVLSATVVGLAPWGGDPHHTVGDIRWVETPPSATAARTSRFRVLVPCPEEARNAPPAQITAEVRLDDKNRIRTQRDIAFQEPPQVAITVDASGTEWSAVSPIVVTTFDGDHKESHQGDSDCSAMVRIGRSATGLCLFVDVTDDEHNQPFSGADTWKGDGIQIAIGPTGDTATKASTCELGFALTNKGAEIFRWTKPVGKVSAATCVIRRTGTITTYEANIPWKTLALPPPTRGTTLGFALVVNDNDGGVREGWLQLYDGIGWRKDPSLFGTLFF